MNKKILFVLTSHNELGNTGKSTGFHLGEVSHPWRVLVDAGLEIDFVSPKGGQAPVDGLDLEDPINKEFWENEEYKQKIENTLKPSEVKVEDYNVIYYAGGHGTMWDFADNVELQTIARNIYEANGIVAAVCHGPAALVNIKLRDGKYLVDGKRINSFTDAEEKAVELDKVVPFLLETKLKKRGAKFENSDLWQPHTTNDQRVITGQNPMSAKGVGEAILQEIIKIMNTNNNTTTEDTRAIVELFYKRRSLNDIDGIIDLIADDIKWEIPGNKNLAPWLGKRSNKEEIREFYSLHEQYVESLIFDRNQLVVDGENAVLVGYLSVRVLKTNKVYNSHFMTHFRIKDKKITHYFLSEDSLELAKVLTNNES